MNRELVRELVLIVVLFGTLVGHEVAGYCGVPKLRRFMGLLVVFFVVLPAIALYFYVSN